MGGRTKAIETQTRRVTEKKEGDPERREKRTGERLMQRCAN